MLHVGSISVLFILSLSLLSSLSYDAFVYYSNSNNSLTINLSNILTVDVDMV